MVATKFLRKKNIKAILCNFSMRMLNLFYFYFVLFFCPQKVEKTTLKSCSEKLKFTFFSSTALTAQTAQIEEFMFQNMAYWPTVFRTGSIEKSPKALEPFNVVVTNGPDKRGNFQQEMTKKSYSRFPIGKLPFLKLTT